MSVSLTPVFEDGRPLRLKGELVSLNWHNEGALAIFNVLGLSGGLFGEFELDVAARGIMRARPHVLKEAARPAFQLGRVTYGAITAESLERRLRELGELIMIAREHGCARIAYG